LRSFSFYFLQKNMGFVANMLPFKKKKIRNFMLNNELRIL
jgi:hypothetical protein